VKITILGTESLGVRGLSCVVETKARKIVIDPGVALGYRRHGLLPHPVQVAVSEKVKDAIQKSLTDATDVVISHYHGDHCPLVDANPYQLSIDTVSPLLAHTRLWSKGLYGIQPHQVYRARALARQLGESFIEAEGVTDGSLSFSFPVPHGESRRRSLVMMTRIADDSEVFVHASDIQMLNDEAIDIILEWKPTIVFAAGPPLYLPQLTRWQRDGALLRVLHLAERIPAVILDHHLMRSLEGEQWLDHLAFLTENRVTCAADFMEQPRRLLEATRVSWYYKVLVPKDWHRAYGAGEASTEPYRKSSL